MELSRVQIHERMKHHHVPGLSMAIIQNGALSTDCFGLLEAGTEREVQLDSIFNACSISKLLASILVMKLSVQGLIDLDEDVNNRLVSWRVASDEYVVTPRHLLSHQSGIIDPEGSFSELNAGDRAPSMAGVLAGRTLYCKKPVEVKDEPGSDFQYSDAGYCIIQLLIEDITGEPFEKIVKELIFEPLKMNNSTFSVTISEKRFFSSGHNRKGELVPGHYPIYPYPAASGLWTTPSDLAVLVIEFMNALRGESKIGLTSRAAEAMISPQGSKEWIGLGLFLDGAGQSVEMSSLGWGIGFQCMMVAHPYQKNGLVIMTNADTGEHQMKGIIGEIYKSWEV
ncbi:serine hydrolase domain-containing protein [Jeotgalibacillus malaysiensis]|uniref:serine hydrolase domain-containing protein n=1 Tax=Jeotgalibacillus malaysiensis TaxID=1508404 RepID=UPI0038516A3F